MLSTIRNSAARVRAQSLKLSATSIRSHSVDHYAKDEDHVGGPTSHDKFHKVDSSNQSATHAYEHTSTTFAPTEAKKDNGEQKFNYGTSGEREGRESSSSNEGPTGQHKKGVA